MTNNLNLKKKNYVLIKNENLLLFNKFLFFINLKYNKNKNLLLFKGNFGLLKLNILKLYKFNYFNFININLQVYQILNVGWISILFLNGLGFKSTRKLTQTKEKYWRFNVGHSHVFQYFSPENIILKSKNRYLCIFSFNKSQLFNISQKLKTFKKINIYKGTGIQYPDELKILKVGKLKQ